MPASVMRMDADAFAHNTQPAMVVLEFSRQEIVSGNLASALERLQILIDTPQNVKLYCNSVVLSVDGYNSDPRELVEIPEVRSFFRRLTHEWPFWLWFLNREEGSVRLAASLLVDCTVLRQSQGFATEFKSLDELKSCVTDLLTRSTPLLVTYEMDRGEIQESALGALSNLGLARR